MCETVSQSTAASSSAHQSFHTDNVGVCGREVHGVSGVACDGISARLISAIPQSVRREGAAVQTHIVRHTHTHTCNVSDSVHIIAVARQRNQTIQYITSTAIPLCLRHPAHTQFVGNFFSLSFRGYCNPSTLSRLASRYPQSYIINNSPLLRYCYGCQCRNSQQQSS